MIFLQKLIKCMPEWLFFGVMFLSLSVIPLIIFNRKWQQVGDLVEATKICAPFIFALAAIGAIVAFLYYNEDLE
ncbi:MAG: hypothetical protein WCH02_04030 [Pseudomonadota bacterium]|jgi:hypothetical protein